MSGTYQNGELGRLVGAMCDGTISADDTGQLDSLLTTDDNARQFYNNYMFLHAELYSQHAAGEPIADCGLRIADSKPSPTRYRLSATSQASMRNCNCFFQVDRAFVKGPANDAAG